MQTSLRTRLTITFIALAIGPLLLVGVILVQRSFAVERQQAIALQNQVVQRVSSEVESFFQEIESDLALRAGEIRTLEDPDQAQVISLLLSAFSTGPYRDVYEGFALLDAQGREQVRLSRLEVLPPESLEDLSGTDIYQQTLATRETYVSPVWYDDVGDPFITIGIPLTEPRSVQVGGILVADLRFREVGDLIAAVERDESQTIYVAGEAGNLVAHDDSAFQLQGASFVEPAGTNRQTGLSGKPVVLATDNLQLGDTSLVVVAERPTSEALALAISIAITIIVVIGLALLIASGLSFFLIVPQIVSPVESLATTARTISGGDLSAQAQVNSGDEIGELAQAFNQMLANIRQRNAELVKATALAEESNRLKSEFLATMSHELRTPLNAIEGFTGIILSGMGGTQYNDKTGAMLERINANSKRLMTLINAILDLSRIESGRMEFANMPFSPAALTRQWQSEIEMLAEEKGLDFRVFLDDHLPETIYGDEEAISKVALNLLSNAIKFTEKGHVSLAVKSIGSDWSITVTDTGIGIPPHARDFVFEEFRQVDQSSRRKYGGSGLGLAIVHKLTRSMGGTVTLRSELGKGSIFTITLPLVTEVYGELPTL